MSMSSGAETMSEKTKKAFEQWSAKLGMNVAELESMYHNTVTQLKKVYPTQTAEWVGDRARHNMATTFSEQLRIKAEAFVVSWIFDGGRVDTNANTISVAKALYADPATRDEAVATGKCFADGTPRDLREWYVEPARSRPGKKNPNFGKELKPFNQRRMIGLGRKFDEDAKILKVIVGTLREKASELDIPLMTPGKMRLNIRVADEFKYGVTSSSKTEFEKIDDETLKKIDLAAAANIFDTAPLFMTATKKGLKTTIFTVVEFLNAHKNDQFAVTILEADIARFPENMTVTGSWPVGVNDAEEDVEARGITCFVPDELYKKKLSNLGLGSRVLWIGTPREAEDMMTQEPTATMNIIDLIVKTHISKEESMMEIGADVKVEE